jgi:hypothetical protein
VFLALDLRTEVIAGFCERTDVRHHRVAAEHLAVLKHDDAGTRAKRSLKFHLEQSVQHLVLLSFASLVGGVVSPRLPSRVKLLRNLDGSPIQEQEKNKIALAAGDAGTFARNDTV